MWNGWSSAHNHIYNDSNCTGIRTQDIYFSSSSIWEDKSAKSKISSKWSLHMFGIKTCQITPTPSRCISSEIVTIFLVPIPVNFHSQNFSRRSQIFHLKLLFELSFLAQLINFKNVFSCNKHAINTQKQIYKRTVIVFSMINTTIIFTPRVIMLNY